MADTGEGREINARTDTKKAGGRGGSKKIVAKVNDRNQSVIAQTPSRQQEGSSASEPFAEWLQVTRVSGLAPFRTSDGKEFTMAESRNKRVLIVDNNEEESGRLGTMLQRAGYDSIATWSGLEALELMKSEEYDILLVSSYLPDVYVGDFFERLNRLPVRPCSIVMQEGCIPVATLQEIKNMVGQEKSQAR